jgi:capsular polysaccharide export protein
MRHAFFFGFSRWKHQYIKIFFQKSPNIEITFINPFFKKRDLELALKKGMDAQSEIYIWGKKEFDEIETFAKEKHITLARMEDGFIRSFDLGSDLTQPYSQVIDKKGIYFDPTQESDLEDILNNIHFDSTILRRAEVLRHYLVEHKISKYNIYGDVTIVLPQNRNIVLVPGQVEDDASIKYGASGMTNFQLLKEARKNSPESYIIYKPHPDVLAGNRVGAVDEKEALLYCDTIVTHVSLDSIVSLCDEVHTMTSLVGFESLLRGKKVFTYGMPFYAGWGLTIDQKSCERRRKKLSLDELTAGAFILYPVYINPQNNRICEIEEILNVIESQKERYQHDKIYKLKKDIRNRIVRKILTFITLLKKRYR